MTDEICEECIKAVAEAVEEFLESWSPPESTEE